MVSIDELFEHFEDQPSTSLNGSTNKRKRRKISDGYPNSKKKRIPTSSDNRSDRDVNSNDSSITDFVFDVSSANVLSDDSCTHEVAYCSSSDLPVLNSPRINPYKYYSFELDTFQKQAIQCIENNQSVLVSAHTSAGKTAIAEYAIAQSLNKRQRIIYTTPIKALSNQKYRELSEEFKDVGLMTGDVSIDSYASCIVMTTEILRSMLYRGSEVIKEVAWVIFDEIHYMRDENRGVIWEETLILLPDNVKFVFLSATIPNARQFAEWVCHVHKQPCNVVYTEKRPTPLQHYIYPATGQRMKLVIDECGNFMENNFNVAMSMLEKQPSQQNTQNKRKNEPNNLTHDLIDQIMRNKWAPVIMFNFSKFDCEKHALSLPDAKFNTESEERTVVEIFNNAISMLNEAEQKLPHITSVLPMLKRGIAFHHSGLLPIVKECVEILFGEGLIKVLFATETFSMGLNMPAKTVVFSKLKKFDGTEQRYLRSGEFIQMSGRAGRRGIDDKGIVVMIAHELISIDNIKSLLLGKADPLNSAFHLKDNMILNLLRQEEVNPEYIIEKSFMRFQIESTLRDNKKRIKELQEILENGDPTAESTQKMKDQLNELRQTRDMFDLNLDIDKLRNVLKEGSLVKVKDNCREYDWGIVKEIIYNSKPKRLMLKVLLPIDEINKNESLLSETKPYSDYSQPPFFKVFTVDHAQIFKISQKPVHHNTFNVTLTKQKIINEKYFQLMQNRSKEYRQELQCIPIDTLMVNSEELNHFNEINQQIDELKHKMNINRHGKSNHHRRKKEIIEEIAYLRSENDDRSFSNVMTELNKRKEVMRMLGYCDIADNVTLKGRVACEFSSNELILNELIFHGILNKIPVNHCVAILSCLICQEKDTEVQIHPSLNQTYHDVKTLIKTISNLCLKANLLEDEDDTIHKFQPNMTSIILTWCNGASFLDICNMTSIYEGSIIRYIRGIEEILRELYVAAKNIGNVDLEVKFSEGIKRLKRGIIFAASLYL